MKENGMLTDGSAVEMSEAEKMIALADSDVSAGIDFVEFFRLFMFTPCITVHQALTEWRNKVALVQRKRTSSETANLGQQGIAGKGGGGESVRGAKRRVEEAGVLDIDMHGRYFRALRRYFQIIRRY